MIMPSGKNRETKFKYSIIKIFAWRTRRAVKRKIKCLQGLCRVLERGIASFLFSVVSLLLLEKKNTALKYACVNYAGRQYPSPELGGPVAYSVHCYTSLWFGVSRALLCCSIGGGQCSLLLWSKKFPLLDLTFTSSLMEAEKPDHLSYLELEKKTADCARNSSSASLNTKTTCESEGFFGCFFF